VNKLEFVKKINEQSLNRLSGSMISLSSARVPKKKLNEPNLNIQYSARLNSISTLVANHDIIIDFFIIIIKQKKKSQYLVNKFASDFVFCFFF
jgi:hypothetical protein